MLSRRQLCGLLALVPLACSDDPITVYVVRHAEKASEPEGDPPLTEEGRGRAEALSKAVGDAKLTAVFSSPYERTKQTVTPAAKKQGLEVRTVDGRDVDGLVATIRGLGGGSRVLVAGHSNTVPQILTALGVSEKVALGEEDYGDLFVVTVGREVRLERRRFGP